MKKQLAEDIDMSSSEDFKPWSPPASIDKGLVEELTIDWKAALELADRREKAQKMCTPCPFCGTMQVQLVNWFTPAIHLKCRRCKHKFVRNIE
jgi:hypothetical protein